MTLPEVIATADALKAELDALRPMPPDTEQRVWQKLRLDWNFHSNNIEGNSLDYGETKLLLLHGITAGNKPLKDYLDIRGHNDALLHLQNLVKQNAALTEADVREFHKIILPEPYQIDAESADGQKIKKQVRIGEYKTTPNHVRTATGEMFYFAEPFEVPAKMHDLMTWYHKSLSDESIHLLLLAATFHYEFIRIHPFDDGNGRIARILMNLALMMKDFPPAIIKTGDKENYYTALRQADAGDLESFVVYIGEQLVHSLELMLKAARGEEIEEEDDVDKQISLLKAKLKASDGATVKRSPEVVDRILVESAFPLFEKVVRKLSLFDELFLEKEITLPEKKFHTPVKPKANDPLSLYLSRDTLQFTSLLYLNDPFSYRLNYEWRGYKHLKQNPFHYHMNFTISFEEFKYVISAKTYNDDKEWDKLFTEIVDEKEQQRIANEVARQVAVEIEARAQQKNIQP
ncbi:MAG: Fic family protein [Rhizobacter sp.]|nr:Fic family protein [Chlorobiales bacterium]